MPSVHLENNSDQYLVCDSYAAIWVQFVFRSELSFLVKSLLLLRESRAEWRGMAEADRVRCFKKNIGRVLSHRNNRKTFDVKKMTVSGKK